MLLPTRILAAKKKEITKQGKKVYHVNSQLAGTRQPAESDSKTSDHHH